MISFFIRNDNTKIQDFWSAPFREIYSQCVEAVRKHNQVFFLPCCQRFSLPNDYIMYGTYERKTIFDIHLVLQSDGSAGYEETVIEGLKIQRIQVVGEGSPGRTQAILPDHFIIYGRHTLRFVLFHLCRFFSAKQSVEAYCLDNRLEPPLLRKWIKWLISNISLLRGTGMTMNREESRDTLGQWIRDIRHDPSAWLVKSLRNLNLSLFQWHKMPDNTVYRSYGEPGKIYLPTQ